MMSLLPSAFMLSLRTRCNSLLMKIEALSRSIVSSEISTQSHVKPSSSQTKRTGKREVHAELQPLVFADFNRVEQRRRVPNVPLLLFLLGNGRVGRGFFSISQCPIEYRRADNSVQISMHLYTFSLHHPPSGIQSAPRKYPSSRSWCSALWCFSQIMLMLLCRNRGSACPVWWSAADCFQTAAQ